MPRTSASILVAAFLLASTPALAKKNSASDTSVLDKETRERDARKACLDGDYATGVKILSDLFLDTKNATYIFNQGRCYEQNERYPEAINRFREYMRTTDEDKEIAQKHIAECQNLAQKSAPVPAPVEGTTQPVGTVTTPAAPKPTPTGDGAGLRTAGLVLAGVGVAGLVVGVALNLKANSLADDITPPNTYQRATESSRKDYETLSWVGYGVGVASLATGTILYFVGRSRASNLAITPIVRAGMAGIVVGRSF